MLWIKSCTVLDRHPKIVQFKARMRWSQNETIGFVHRLWWLVAEYAPQSGSLRSLPPMVVGELLGMKDADIEKAFGCMIEAGLIDQNGEELLIHDWDDFGGKVFTSRVLDAERKKKSRSASVSSPPDVFRTSGGHPRPDKNRVDKNRNSSRAVVEPPGGLEEVHAACFESCGGWFPQLADAVAERGKDAVLEALSNAKRFREKSGDYPQWPLLSKMLNDVPDGFRRAAPQQNPIDDDEPEDGFERW